MSDSDDAKDAKDDVFGTDGATEYLIAGQTVAEIVLALLSLVLAFVGPERAKALIDAEVQKANQDADRLERAKFGN